MNIIRETFNKSERLCSTKMISGLFEDGHTFHNQLFKVVWIKSPVLIPYPAQIVISVSKRSFRLAVTRNLIKRRVREAYRKNKNLLYDFLTAENKQVVFIVIVKGTKVPDYTTIEKAIRDMTERLILQIREKS
ncbi:MAG: ribonuclease P protein component [Bacteroidales bacterium]|nr:ribonuclease P protein component [Bacteroidales bacterium]MBK8882633.1 ribonuclease P protein component [Bacteroidales bacterium]